MQTFVRENIEIWHGGYKIQIIKEDLANIFQLNPSEIIFVYNNVVLENKQHLKHYEIPPNDGIWVGTLAEYYAKHGEHVLIELKADFEVGAIAVTENVLMKRDDRIFRIRSVLVKIYSWIARVGFRKRNGNLLLDDETIEECGLIDDPIIQIGSLKIVVAKGAAFEETVVNKSPKFVMGVNAYQLSPMMEIFRQLINTNNPNGSLLSRILELVQMPEDEGIVKQKLEILISDWVKYFDRVERHETLEEDRTSIFRQDFLGFADSDGKGIKLSTFGEHLLVVNKLFKTIWIWMDKFLPEQFKLKIKWFENTRQVIFDAFHKKNEFSSDDDKIVDLRLINLQQFYLDKLITFGTPISKREMNSKIICCLPEISLVILQMTTVVTDYWKNSNFTGSSQFCNITAQPNFVTDGTRRIMSAAPMKATEAIDILSNNSSTDSNAKTYYLTSPNFDNFYDGTKEFSRDTRVNFMEISGMDQFQMIKKLGSGAHGSVCVYRKLNDNPPDKTYVMKEIKINKRKKMEDISFLLSEIITFSKLAPHRRIIQYFDYHMKERSFFIEMEYMKNGSLRKYLLKHGPQSSKSIQRFSSQILEGLKYLHDKSIFHRDIKADNVLLDEHVNAKLADFGLAKCFDESSNVLRSSFKHSTGLGTVLWMAPEITTTQFYGSSADIWSFGVTVIEMVAGKHPYQHMNPVIAQLEIAKHGTIKYDCPQNRNLKNFIDSCLKLDSRERWSVDQLLESDFIKEPIIDE